MIHSIAPVRLSEKHGKLLLLNEPVRNDYFIHNEFSCFDKDGFDLNAFERGLYQANGVDVTWYLNRPACQHVWFFNPENGKRGNVYVDHSMIMHRFGYAGPLLRQIQKWSDYVPVLYKLTKLTPKWGIDVNIEYIFDDGEVMEVFHYEEDFTKYNEYTNTRAHITNIIEKTNWEDGAYELRKCKDLWKDMVGDDQTDFKAKFFGFDRAYITRKVV